jgi:hypothetical protein
VLIMTVDGVLFTNPSLTTSWAVYDPGLSTTKLGCGLVVLLRVAVLPDGTEVSDH